jgi:ketosteroid isomerase-like protein
MSQENVETVRRIFEDFETPGWDTALALLDPDVEFDWSAAEGPYADIYRGREAVRQVTEGYFGDEAWERVSITPDVLHADSDIVVVLAHIKGRGKLSGVEVEARLAQVWTVRGGKVVRMKYYHDKTEAFEAVGLSEQDAHADS